MLAPSVPVDGTLGAEHPTGMQMKPTSSPTFFQQRSLKWIAHPCTNPLGHLLCVLIKRDHSTENLLNCLKLNLKCPCALLLSAHYAEFLLWPYDERTQEIRTNFPPDPEKRINYCEHKVSTTPINQCDPFKQQIAREKNLRGLTPCYSHSQDVDITQQLCLRLSQSQHSLYRY